MQTTWMIDNMDRDRDTGAVTSVHWRVNVSHEEITRTAYGQVLVSGDPTAPGFVPYAALTQDQVIQWVKDVLTAENQRNNMAMTPEQIQQQLESEVQSALEPKSLPGVPWR